MKSEALKNDEMHKRREIMADNRRYIIYYTFGVESGAPPSEIGTENETHVVEMINSDSETNSIK